jgi:hypothetical protein
MITKTKIAICVAVLISAASTGFAKDQNARRAHAEVTTESNGPIHSFVQAQFRRQGRCWVPTRDQGDEYGADTRGVGYWGSCSEQGAVRSK